MYPYTKTINPYRYQINDYLEGLPLQDQVLHNELLHAITLLNQRGRLKDHSKIISSQLDVIIAMELIQDSTINASAISSYHVLYKVYQDRVFTLLDAQRTLKKSATTTKRYFESLQTLNLLEKVEEKRGAKHLYKLIKRNTDLTPPSPSIYEQGLGEWKDYQGFVEF